MSDKNNLELDREGMPVEWQYNDSNFGNSSMGIVSNGSNMIGRGDGVGPSGSSNGVMVDSFGSVVWDHPVDSVSLGFNETNVHSCMFIPNMPSILPESLSQFPADSAFIERAARFSSFSGGHFSQLLNPFALQQSFPNMGVVSKDVSLPLNDGVGKEDSPMKETMVERSRGEVKQCVSVSGNGNGNASDELQYNGDGTREDSSTFSAKGVGANKRKRNNRDVESNQATGVQQQSSEGRKKTCNPQQKREQKSVNKSNRKQSSQNSDPPKDDYIHVRARRGQATNSHSLAERVRREKISERMKFLQDLVPGCSKVTGKAVMLDEIINYVQSLQRQVEFLSMKLATVNPRSDSNFKQLLMKDHMFSRSGIGISTSLPMSYPGHNPSQPPGLQPEHPGISDLLRGTINSHLTNIGAGYTEPTHQLPNPWEDEIHNVVQTGFNSPLNTQETNCVTAQGLMKAEPCHSPT